MKGRGEKRTTGGRREATGGEGGLRALPLHVNSFVKFE